MNINQIDLSPESLKKVAKKTRLEMTLKELELKHEELKIRSEIEAIDLSGELGELDQEIKNLKKEKEEYASSKEPVLELIQKQTTVEERLKKLNERKDQISSTVFESLKTEYLEEKETITKQISQTITQLKKIRQDASKGTETLKYAIEELSIRKDIEEIPDDVYNERISNLKSEMAQSEELLTAVSFLLKLVEK
ncbi:MAG: hypothetical protein ACFE9L_15590 [Candidatus Hodarchaeota archaeon]